MNAAVTVGKGIKEIFVAFYLNEELPAAYYPAK
jgi:hypothetical protein